MTKMEKQSASPPSGLIKHDLKSLGILDPTAIDMHGTSDASDDTLFFGNGNKPTNFNISVDQKADIELGLKVHYRTGDDITPTSVGKDGTAYYDVPAGAQVVDPAHDVYSAKPDRAAWSFDYSVNTAIDGSTKTLDNFQFRMVITSGDGETAVYDMQHVAAGNTPWVNAATGGAFGDEDGTNAQLSQNSENISFMLSTFGADALNSGETYDIKLQAFDDHGKIITEVHDFIHLV